MEFPGETDEHFLETYHFLNEMDISYLHVFTYSERDNTEAATMEGVVPINVRNKRSKMLLGLSVKKRRTFYESQIGSNKTVLFESENKEGYIHGFTENYVKVKTPWNPELVNTLHNIHLTKIDGVDLVLGATEKFKITDYINDLSKNDLSEIHSCEIEEADFYVGSYSIGDRTRAFLKVQDGCDYKCTYCTIPLARGISRSDNLENVVQMFYF